MGKHFSRPPADSWGVPDDQGSSFFCVGFQRHVESAWGTAHTGILNRRLSARGGWVLDGVALHRYGGDIGVNADGTPNIAGLINNAQLERAEWYAKLENLTSLVDEYDVSTPLADFVRIDCADGDTSTLCQIERVVDYLIHVEVRRSYGVTLWLGDMSSALCGRVLCCVWALAVLTYSRWR